MNNDPSGHPREKLDYATGKPIDDNLRRSTKGVVRRRKHLPEAPNDSAHYTEPTLVVPQGGGAGYVGLGWILLIAGIVGVIYFMFGFDASVASNFNFPNGLIPSGATPDRVNNMGLMVDKVCGVIASASGSIVGSVLIVAGQVQGIPIAK